MIEFKEGDILDIRSPISSSISRMFQKERSWKTYTVMNISNNGMEVNISLQPTYERRWDPIYITFERLTRYEIKYNEEHYRKKVMEIINA